MKEEELEKLGNKKLREIVRYCYKYVPYYKTEWKKKRIKPEDIKTLADLKKLPTISKKIVQKNYKKFISVEYKKYLNLFYRAPSFLYMRSTSGTSGKPIRVYYNPDAKDYLDAIYARALLNVRYNPWKKILYYWWQQPPQKDIYNKFGLFRKIFVQHPWDEDKQLEVMKSVKPEYLYYYPSALYFIARKVLYGGVELGFKPKLIISHAELLTEGMRKTIEDAFDCDVFDEYGTNEFNRVGWECEERNGYHVDCDSVHVEIVDHNNNEVSDGEMGRVFLTGLINKVIPLIRYDIGDFVVKSGKDQKIHNCGINLPVLIKSIEGRVEHTINIKHSIITQKRILDDIICFMEKRKEIYKFQAFMDANKKEILINYVPFDKDFSYENEKNKMNGFKLNFKKVNSLNKNEVSGKILIFEVK